MNPTRVFLETLGALHPPAINAEPRNAGSNGFVIFLGSNRSEVFSRAQLVHSCWSDIIRRDEIIRRKTVIVIPQTGQVSDPDTQIDVRILQSSLSSGHGRFTAQGEFR